MPPGGHGVAEKLPGRKEALRWLRRLDAGDDAMGTALLIVVAHPDDDVIGTGGQLSRLGGVRLLHVTDGAPRNLRDAATAGFERWQDYARARRAELLAALALTGIAPGRPTTWVSRTRPPPWRWSSLPRPWQRSS